MNTSHIHYRKSVLIPNSRWLAYTTASVATTFACMNSADATIHYSGRINQVFNGCHQDAATFPLDQAGDFIRFNDSVLGCFTSYGGGAYFAVTALAGAAFAGRQSSCGDPGRVLASRLDSGELISNRPFSSAPSAALAVELSDFCHPNGGWIGQFDGKGIGFIGFRFDNGSGAHYGWARIKMPKKGRNPNQNFKLLDYAWGDVGDRIKAGQRSSQQARTNQGSLGLLAVGAAGLLASRKRRPKTS